MWEGGGGKAEEKARLLEKKLFIKRKAYNLFRPPFGGFAHKSLVVWEGGGGKAKEKAHLLEKKLFIERRDDYAYQKHVIQHVYLPYVSCDDAKICGY